MRAFVNLSLLWSGILPMWRGRRARAALSALDDRMLRDIGVSRHEIERLGEHEPAREATRLRALESCRQQAGRVETATRDGTPAPASGATENAGPGAAVIDLAGFRARTRRRAAPGFAAEPTSAGRSRPH
jgi:uncharacterized protein YjiS (DUF1127 family)